MRLTVKGRNLEGMFDRISYHRLAWIRSIDERHDVKGAVPDDAPMVPLDATERTTSRQPSPLSPSVASCSTSLAKPQLLHL